MSSVYGPDDPAPAPDPERDPELDDPSAPDVPGQDPDAQPEQE